MWYMSHMFPKESVQAHLDIKGKKLQPIHFGVFTLSIHDWDAPILDALAYAKEAGVEIVVAKMGEIVRVSEPYQQDSWFAQ